MVARMLAGLRLHPALAALAKAAEPQSAYRVLEAVAGQFAEKLGFEGAEFCRGYIQSWLKTDSIPEASAKKILGAAQRILAAGRSDSEKAELN